MTFSEHSLLLARQVDVQLEGAGLVVLLRHDVQLVGVRVWETEPRWRLAARGGGRQGPEA
eukprot:6485141-Heterocapsa_arctica.AAC.1